MLHNSHGPRECNGQLVRLPREAKFHALQKHEFLLDDVPDMCYGQTFCDIEFDQPAQNSPVASRMICPKCVKAMQSQGKLLTFF